MNEAQAYDDGHRTGFKKGRERCGNRLFDRPPPESLSAPAQFEWERGYRKGLEDRALYRRTMITYDDENGQLTHKHFLGHRTDRGKILTRLERSGVTGDVYFTYFTGDTGQKEVKCGI